MNEGVSNVKAEKKSRGMESAVSISEAILHRVITIQGRLAEMDARLHGEQTEGGCDSKDCEPTPGGVMGQLYAVHQATLERCDSVDGWLSRIENTA